MPYVIYADLEALIKKISLCELEGGNKEKSYIIKKEYHEASGFSYTVVRSDGEVSGLKVYRGENAVGKFLREILQEEVKIRESLAAPKPIVGWQGGRVVRVLDFESVGPGFESHSEHFMDLFLGCPEL